MNSHTLYRFRNSPNNPTAHAYQRSSLTGRDNVPLPTPLFVYPRSLRLPHAFQKHTAGSYPRCMNRTTVLYAKLYNNRCFRSFPSRRSLGSCGCRPTEAAHLAALHCRTTRASSRNGAHSDVHTHTLVLVLVFRVSRFQLFVFIHTQHSTPETFFFFVVCGLDFPRKRATIR